MENVQWDAAFPCMHTFVRVFCWVWRRGVGSENLVKEKKFLSGILSLLSFPGSKHSVLFFSTDSDLYQTCFMILWEDLYHHLLYYSPILLPPPSPPLPPTNFTTPNSPTPSSPPYSHTSTPKSSQNPFPQTSSTPLVPNSKYKTTPPSRL